MRLLILLLLFPVLALADEPRCVAEKRLPYGSAWRSLNSALQADDVGAAATITARFAETQSRPLILSCFTGTDARRRELLIRARRIGVVPDMALAVVIMSAGRAYTRYQGEHPQNPDGLGDEWTWLRFAMPRASNEPTVWVTATSGLTASSDIEIDAVRIE